jgi:hypothetical protein
MGHVRDYTNLCARFIGVCGKAGLAVFVATWAHLQNTGFGTEGTDLQTCTDLYRLCKKCPEECTKKYMKSVAKV